MPRRPATPCNHPGCPELVRGRFCDAHEQRRTQRYDRERGSSAARGYGGRWRRLRRMILARDPLCRDCGRAASTDVDHIVPKRQGGTDREDNLQGLCKSCHSTKTALEDGRWG